MLHLPGHTPGHLGLWDAAVGLGDRDRRDPRPRHPRPCRDAADPAADLRHRGLRATIARVAALAPERLLTAHFPVLEGDAVGAFLERSRAQDEGVAAAVREGCRRRADLWALTERADRRLGPYPEFKLELAAAVRDHARRQGPEISNAGRPR